MSKPIRECYFPAIGCDDNEDMECYAPVRKRLQCQIEMEDYAYQSQWEQMHEPPEDTEFKEKCEE